MSGVRLFRDSYLKLETQEDITDQVISTLPAPEVIEAAVTCLVLEHLQAWAPLVDDRSVQE